MNLHLKQIDLKTVYKNYLLVFKHITLIRFRAARVSHFRKE